MPEIERTAEEIDEQYGEAIQVTAEGTRVPGMSYEEGVRDSLAWVLGDRDEPPMED